MSFLEILIDIPDESREALLGRLSDIGSSGFYERDGRIAAYFENVSDINLICNEIEQFRETLQTSGLNPDISFECSVLPEVDWNESWKKGFTPIDVGDNLIIIPSWLKYNSERLPIIIDPGMVFGTGHHETTRMCLVLIERFSREIKKDRFIDIGTGTGILAICASKLGFKQVIAIDTDPMCIDSARSNAYANGLNEIEIKVGSIYDTEGTFNMIAANLLAEILIGISFDVSRRLEPNGIAIFSGMLEGQEDNVIETAVNAGLTLLERVYEGRWVSLVFKGRS